MVEDKICKRANVLVYGLYVSLLLISLAPLELFAAGHPISNNIDICSADLASCDKACKKQYHRGLDACAAQFNECLEWSNQGTDILILAFCFAQDKQCRDAALDSFVSCGRICAAEYNDCRDKHPVKFIPNGPLALGHLSDTRIS